MKLSRLAITIFTAILAVFLIASPVMAAGELVKYAGNPVLWPTDPGETQGVGAPCVLLDSGVYPYKMWYTGVDASGLPCINFAESNDGIFWAKEITNPRMIHGSIGEWDADGVGGACVIRDGSEYKMWYTGLTGTIPSIGLAWSIDGIEWNKVGTLPVLFPGTNVGEWDHDGVAFPSVIKDGGVYKMWYTGRKFSGPGPSLLGTLAIGYAQSPDGVNWTKEINNPVLSANAMGWDNRGVGACSVQMNAGFYQMYYTGFVSGVPGVVSRIGEITSSDPVTWENAAEYVLDVGAGWDSFGVAAPTWVRNGGNIEMWYTGADLDPSGAGGAGLKIGQAHTENPPVPASSNTSTAVLVAGFVVLIGGVSVWSIRRNKSQSR